MRASTVGASLNMRLNSSAPSYIVVPAASVKVRLNGFDMASEYTAAPWSVASSTNRLALSQPAVGASTLERAPRPWITTGMRDASDMRTSSASSSGVMPPTAESGR